MWIIQIVSISAQFAIWIIVLFGINPSMTALCLLAAPFTLLVVNKFRKLATPLLLEQRRLFAEMNTFLQQDIIGTRVIRIFRQEKWEEEAFSKVNEEYFDFDLRLTNIRSLYPGLNTVIIGLTTALIYWLGGRLILATYGTLMVFKLGDLMIFVQGITSLLSPLRLLGFRVSTYTEANAAATRIFEINDATPEVKDKPDAIILPPIKGEVVFENVSFEYLPNKPVLKNINLTVEEGETVAILGPTGSGKSTLLYLIPGFYDVTSGRILIDSYDIRDVKLGSLREQIGIALHEIFLFQGTVMENIKYGKPNATDAEAIEAAKAVNAHDFIMKLPDGYNTVIREGSTNISLGQRQLITFARALILSREILILDEATSSVDPYMEHIIQEGLGKLLENRTAIIIAHRLSTIRNSDMIVVIDSGEIKEIGKHDELVAKGGIYKQLYTRQFRDETSES